MNNRSPAFLRFAQPDKSKSDSTSIYKYLADAGFEESEVLSWGSIGSLMEALSEGGKEASSESIKLDDSFVDFVKKLPPGNTPRPYIRHQMQKPVPF